MKKYKKVRGMHDIIPQNSEKWSALEHIMQNLAKSYGYSEIRTPVVEEQDLFERSIGMETDIISKEMYAFEDKKGRRLALRPEGTASVARAYIEAGLYAEDKNSRLFYYGPMYRYDRPQKGRYRQFYQFGVELIGGQSPFFDGEVIEVLHELLKAAGVEKHLFSINSLGCADCQVRYTEMLQRYLEEVKNELCVDCNIRVNVSPMRVLDCKNNSCKSLVSDAPPISGIFCEGCKRDFKLVVRYIENLKIPHIIDSKLVRGLDYYTNTVFEAYSREGNNAIAAGGRYNNLISDLGGPAVPAVGFAIGMERLISLSELQIPSDARLYVILLGNASKLHGSKISQMIRNHGIIVEVDYEDRGLKAGLKTADKKNFQWCLIIGDNELQNDQVLLKNMIDGKQETINSKELLTIIKERLS